MVVTDHNRPVFCIGIALFRLQIQALTYAQQIHEILIRVLHGLDVLLVE
ncbi:hypothetical protein J2Z69_002417 [Paenibacillus shirakamiensis]|uniref:Uncharacterized protein n=1 Tax=Paenibacillus shirakamiensis TaxID=1265935 RepID=A0ABS4JLA6_9BACL|nr:hypothetical protein [Paenibacillus shirakamiensis]